MNRNPRVGIFLVIALLLGAIPSYSRTWHVNPDSTGDAPSIQAAIDSSQAGDSIVVAAGTYEQAIILNNKDSLSIISEEGASKTILRTPTYTILGISDSQYIAIAGFVFEQFAGHGLIVEYSSDVIIKNCIFRNGSASAIVLWGSYEITIQGNLIHSNVGGIFCTDFCSYIEVTDNTISHNGNGTGIYYGDTYECYASNNIISYNHCGIDAIVLEAECNDVFGNDVNYSLLIGTDPTGTDGNISADPLFCGVDPASSGNYLLQKESPCAPGNHPDGYLCGLIGRNEVGCGSTAVEKTTWGKIKSFYQ
jgi:parallel beta-helix repeat protein